MKNEAGLRPMKHGFATRKGNFALRFMAQRAASQKPQGFCFIFAERMLHFLLRSALKYAIIKPRKAVFVLHNGNTVERRDGAPLKMLFIGNSATYVNDIPGTLVDLSGKAGYSLESYRVVKGGATLSFHADLNTEHGENVLRSIRSGYDIIWLQDNGNCVSGEEKRQASVAACKTLGALIRDTGARVGIYLRPPYGYEKWGLTPFEQCKEFDRHFLSAAEEFNPLNAYVNRAFAFAIRDTGYDLWGEDHAHTGAYGAYLAVCVFFATVFHTTSSVLDANGLPLEDARVLQTIADRVVLKEEIPW